MYLKFDFFKFVSGKGSKLRGKVFFTQLRIVLY